MALSDADSPYGLVSALDGRKPRMPLQAVFVFLR